jgi:DNA-binding LytR/AlgR family response regulator
MIRLLLLSLSLSLLPGVAHADRMAWEACAGRAGTQTLQLSDCRALEGPIDPQGREMWIRAEVPRPQTTSGARLCVVGVASSEAWLNGVRLGANGRPGSSASTERPGRYEADYAIPSQAWQPGKNVLILRVSSFHGGLRLAAPIGRISVETERSARVSVSTALTLALGGALLAAAFGFGVIHALRRTGSSLMLAGIAGTAAAQAVFESLRSLVAYPYPLHVWRLSAIWLLAATFSLLLVLFIARRFHKDETPRLILVSAAAIGLTAFAPGFDLKTIGALLVGLALSCGVLALNLRDVRARWAIAYLAIFIVLALAAPGTFVDFSYFLFAASLLLPLLMLEVVRLGRDDQQRQEALARAASPADRIAVVASGRVELVPLSDIVAITGADDYVELHLPGGRRLLHAARLDRLEEQLPDPFVRVHRSSIANLAHAAALERDGRKWRLVLEGAGPLAVSGPRLMSLKAALSAHPGH